MSYSFSYFFIIKWNIQNYGTFEKEYFFLCIIKQWQRKIFMHIYIFKYTKISKRGIKKLFINEKDFCQFLLIPFPFFLQSHTPEFNPLSLGIPFANAKKPGKFFSSFHNIQYFFHFHFILCIFTFFVIINSKESTA